MSLKRGSVLGLLVLCLVLMGTVDIQAQGNGNGNGRWNTPSTTTSYDLYDLTSVRALITALQSRMAQLDQALLDIAALKVALSAEISARQAADIVLQNNIDAISGGGLTQADLDAAIAAEGSARADADAALRADIDALEPLAPLASIVSVDTGTINDLAGPHVIFTGANVHIRSGHSWGDSLAQNGKGNLVVGYNESAGYDPAERGGSHNVVVGPYHRYNFGVGLVVGYHSRLGGDGASVSGGFQNNAGAEFSSVSAGSNNQATGMFASVSGGDSNTAGGSGAAISGGQLNQAGDAVTATGDLSSVSGGFNNAATATLSTVGGGKDQTNSTGFTFVP